MFLSGERNSNRLLKKTDTDYPESYSRFMYRAIDPSEYLTRANANDFPHRFFEYDCLSEI